MAVQRVLLKLSSRWKPSGGSDGPTLAGSNLVLRRLFAAPRGAGEISQGLTAEESCAWYSAEAKPGQSLGAGATHPWDLAHSMLTDGQGLGGATLLAAEPDLEQGWPWASSDAQPFAAASADFCTPDGEKSFRVDKGEGFSWHLGREFSGLSEARRIAGERARAITVVHLDTGYDKDHTALPENLAPADLHRNFVEGGLDAGDVTPPAGLLKNRGHGTGTLGILAGGSTAGLRSRPDPPPDFGALGGAPLARVVPVRIANSVVHFWTSTVAQGIDYAREIGADVVSMSMGGLPSAAWADAVNAAYEAGVVLVCAAGNSYGGLPTSLIVYPARFNRVVAACGVMAKGHPYFGLGGPMEGNVGPAGKMATAMAAYTPNIPWLRIGCRDVVDMDGAGTSAATPQVAAAAALWLAQHGDNFERSWRRVEAVRAALFGSAGRAEATTTPSPYFGRGTLRAADALGIVPDPASLRQTPPDDASFAFLHLLTSAFGAAGDERRQAMFRLELTQLALSSRGAREAVPEPAASSSIPDRDRRRFAEAILDEGKSSQALQAYLGGVLGRTTVAGSRFLPAAQPQAPLTQGWRLPRKIAIPAPSRRRLRVFATDPGDSSRLQTSFINIATIDVPWEPLQPGPVGEYIEVVDVDPASNAAYPPVDLEYSHLVAQDGFAPTEGNPQFHQQMVYAVAMRTVRNFELALGRKALWAERRMPSLDGHFVPASDRGFVQRLRIYPHALRDRNAFYSPDRKALLFGYFDEAQGKSGGRRTIFTCLSHDIVAHETTHALLDGMHRRFQESTNPDVLAFHEAFADIVAIFQHFTFPELLRYEIGRLRGDMSQASILSDLARQFGQALHNKRALRDALPSKPAPGDAEGPAVPLQDYRDTAEAHERGAILVAAVFEAFVAIYSRRTEDLMRLSSGGSGTVGRGAIHLDLVNRLADTAVDTAQRIVTTAIRALDYMPPVDPTFTDYLRAIVTADANYAPDHGVGYRVALAEAFSRRGIYPDDVTNVSPDSLLWQSPAGPVQSGKLKSFMQGLDLGSYLQNDRRAAFEAAKKNAALLHGWMAAELDVGMAMSLGLDFRPVDGVPPKFEVHSVRPALRLTEDGETRTDVVVMITQWRDVPISPGNAALGSFKFRGGCTLLLDRDNGTDPIRYAIVRPVWSETRAAAMRRYLYPGRESAADTYPGGGGGPAAAEPFCMMHSGLSSHSGEPARG